MSSSVSWWLRCPFADSPNDSRAARVRRLIGWPSMTWVPAVTTGSGPLSSIAPAITERAALPVQRVTSVLPRPGPATGFRPVAQHRVTVPDTGRRPGGTGRRPSGPPSGRDRVELARPVAEPGDRPVPLDEPGMVDVSQPLPDRHVLADAADPAPVHEVGDLVDRDTPDRVAFLRTLDGRDDGEVHTVAVVGVVRSSTRYRRPTDSAVLSEWAYPSP